MKRQCGYRKKGGVYLTVPTSENGMPIEFFLLDPPLPVELPVLGIGPRGVHLIEKEGVWHVFDVVGQENYPNVCDLIEEARVWGISRRCELLDYSQLTAESRLVLLHQRAYIRNFTDYPPQFGEQERRDFRCPKNKHSLDTPEVMCAGLWRHDLFEGIEPVNNDESYRRSLECGVRYRGYRRPQDITPEYQYAIFGIFPIGQLEVIADPGDGMHEQKLERARKAQLPVSLVQE
jgi:hypothetical protein